MHLGFYTALEFTGTGLRGLNGGMVAWLDGELDVLLGN